MKKLKTRKFVVIVAVVLLFVAVYMFYSRPMSIPQRYPMLTLEKCTGITGYYHDGDPAGFTHFSVDRESEEFEVLCELLYERDYRRGLRDLFPRGGRAHQSQPGDFQWEVSFHFEDVAFPDGSIGSGEMLRIQSWYGELDIHFDGGMLSCYTNKQGAWEKEVYNTIR